MNGTEAGREGGGTELRLVATGGETGGATSGATGGAAGWQGLGWCEARLGQLETSLVALLAAVAGGGTAWTGRAVRGERADGERGWIGALAAATAAVVRGEDARQGHGRRGGGARPGRGIGRDGGDGRRTGADAGTLTTRAEVGAGDAGAAVVVGAEDARGQSGAVCVVGRFGVVAVARGLGAAGHGDAVLRGGLWVRGEGLGARRLRRVLRTAAREARGGAGPRGRRAALGIAGEVFGRADVCVAWWPAEGSGEEATGWPAEPEPGARAEGRRAAGGMRRAAPGVVEALAACVDAGALRRMAGALLAEGSAESPAWRGSGWIRRGAWAAELEDATWDPWHGDVLGPLAAIARVSVQAVARALGARAVPLGPGAAALDADAERRLLGVGPEGDRAGAGRGTRAVALWRADQLEQQEWAIVRAGARAATPLAEAVAVRAGVPAVAGGRHGPTIWLDAPDAGLAGGGVRRSRALGGVCVPGLRLTTGEGLVVAAVGTLVGAPWAPMTTAADLVASWHPARRAAMAAALEAALEGAGTTAPLRALAPTTGPELAGFVGRAAGVLGHCWAADVGGAAMATPAAGAAG